MKQTTTVTTMAKCLIAMAAAMTLAMGMALPLAGCADDGQVIREGIGKELDPLKNPTREHLEPLLSQMDEDDTASLEAYGIDIYEFCGHAFRGFDYRIGSVEVDGDTATVDISMTNIDVASAAQKALAGMQGDAEEAARIGRLYAEGGQPAVMEHAFDVMYAAMDAEQDTVVNEVTLTLVKTGNQWSIDRDGTKNLISAMYGGLV